MTQLASLLPISPLTDEVFAFNATHILNIRQYQRADSEFLQLPAVQALAYGISGMRHGVRSVGPSGCSTLLVGGGFPGGRATQRVKRGIDKTESSAEQLLDPSRVIRDHIKHSNYIDAQLPGAMKAVDTSIRTFSHKLATCCKDLYSQAKKRNTSLIVELEDHLEEVLDALDQMSLILTQDDVEEGLQVSIERYRAILNTTLRGSGTHFLKEIAEHLPLVIKTISDVRAAFETVGENLALAKNKILQGTTDPKYIFAEKHGKVEKAWKNYEAKRKTLTYTI